MKRFVEIEYWDYMDMKPNTEVRVFEGSDEENLEKNVNDFVAHMKSTWCSGTTRLIGILGIHDAADWIDRQIVKEKTNWQDDSEEFIEKIKGLFEECYEIGYDEYWHEQDIANDYASREL